MIDLNSMKNIKFSSTQAKKNKKTENKTVLNLENKENNE